MADAGCFRGGELEAVALIIVPSAQEDAVAFLAALGHAQDVDEESAALLEFRGEQFEMGKMGDIEDRLAVHAFASHSKKNAAYHGHRAASIPAPARGRAALMAGQPAC
jgi:hypothetical protein